MTDLAIPEFLTPGTQTSIGSYTFTEDDIIRFATRFDPQIFHTDAKAARETMLGGLCASGWHTASVWMKLQRAAVADHLSELRAEGRPYPEFGPSPGMQNLRWYCPVFVGDTISYSNTTKGIRQSNSRKGWWILDNYSKGVNQHGDCVMDFSSVVFLKILK